jgi:hypothetical protein
LQEVYILQIQATQLQSHPILFLSSNPPCSQSTDHVIGKIWTFVIWIFKLYFVSFIFVLNECSHLLINVCKGKYITF